MLRINGSSGLQELQYVLVSVYSHSSCSLNLTCVATPQAHQTATDASKTTALETQIEWNFWFEGLKYRLDNVEEARKKDEKKMEVMMEMIMQLQDESSRKRKVGEDVGRAEESSKKLKKRTCFEIVEEF
jgi:hypothetical protein